MRNILFFIVLTFSIIPTMTLANDAHGVWSTEKNDEGGYVEITVANCESEATKTCGVISKAIGKSGENPNYKHLGRLMIKDMKDNGDGTFGGGTIWDPGSDKTYKSKMVLKEDKLDVDGCISIFCRGQHWKRVIQ